MFIVYYVQMVYTLFWMIIAMQPREENVYKQLCWKNSI